MRAEQPAVGFISLGCPKALVDSERILTQISADGYAITDRYDDADLVIVNTCGFINEAVAESLNTISEAIRQNGKVIVTGCLGVKPEIIRRHCPDVLAITGPQAYESVMGAVHEHLPKPAHNPYLDLIPPAGLKLTPRHYAYLKIAEGCDHHCTFCIIPDLRGRLVSRPADAVLKEAQNLVKLGVKELLVVSQDTSAYGADLGARGIHALAREHLIDEHAHLIDAHAAVQAYRRTQASQRNRLIRRAARAHESSLHPGLAPRNRRPVEGPHDDVKERRTVHRELRCGGYSRCHGSS